MSEETTVETPPVVQLVPSSDPILRTPMEKFDFHNPPINPIELYNLVASRMIDLAGVGLSSNQLGLPYNFFVIRTEPIMGMFNAEIVDSSEDMLEFDEGCLSWPGLSLSIKRPQVIRLRYTDPRGERFTKKYQDMTARIIQHELDHIKGIPFAARVSSLVLEMALKKAKKNGYNYSKKDVL